MATKKPSYELAEVTCEKKNCNETFSVIISSVHTVVEKPIGEMKLISSNHNNDDELAETNRFDDYLVIKCSCGHSQRVYLKVK